MIFAQELQDYLLELLNGDQFQDYCPNGLQVEGKKEIHKIISGVSISQELINKAVKNKADAILVHHGIFWRGDDPCILGVKRARLKELLKHDINLFAYHLPLDFHPVYGNNVLLAKFLNIDTEAINPYVIGNLKNKITVEQFVTNITKHLERAPFHVATSKKELIRVACCSGAAEQYLEEAAAMGADAYLTGEVSERSVYIARELGIHLFAAGHYATERYGIKALADQVAEKFTLKHEFIEIDNPL